MELNSKEIQLLTLLAKNRDKEEALALFEELKGLLTPPARTLAEQILNKTVSHKKRPSESTADVFIRLADARKRARENRSFAVPH